MRDSKHKDKVQSTKQSKIQSMIAQQHIETTTDNTHQCLQSKLQQQQNI